MQSHAARVSVTEVFKVRVWGGIKLCPLVVSVKFAQGNYRKEKGRTGMNIFIL